MDLTQQAALSLYMDLCEGKTITPEQFEAFMQTLEWGSGMMRVPLRSLRELLEENARLRTQVTDLQKHNTALLLRARKAEGQKDA